MKLGFLTQYSEDMVEFAEDTGCECLELHAGPGSPLDADKLIGGKWGEIKDRLNRAGIEISSLAFHPNHLDPNADKRRKNSRYFRKLISLAAEMEVPVVSTFAGAVPGKSIPETIPIFKRVWTPLVKHAEKEGVKIAIENCPMFHGYPFYGINIAYKPEAWDLMFKAIPSKNLGLEFDPSHLYWLHIDHLQTLRDYRNKIFHVHAKDTEILYDKFAVEGIYGHGWWRYRIPGWGEIDWQQFVAALLDIGYNGNIDIEHEDPVFHGKRHKQGLLLGLRHLSQYLP